MMEGTHKGETGIGKGKRQNGLTKGEKTWTRAVGDWKGIIPGRDHPTPPLQTDTNREEQRGGSDQTMEPVDGERERGDMPGYTPTQEDLCLQEVYGDWVHANSVTRLDGGIRDNKTW